MLSVAQLRKVYFDYVQSLLHNGIDYINYQYIPIIINYFLNCSKQLLDNFDLKYGIGANLRTVGQMFFCASAPQEKQQYIINLPY